MKNLSAYILLVVIIILQSCTAPKYFHDADSLKRQQKLQNCRSANIFCDVFCCLGSAVFSVATETELTYTPQEQEFKKIQLINPTNDTLYVNMLTDLKWDEENFCDFMDLRIPPKIDCKVLVPLHANYHLYFSNTPESDDDELLEIYTDNVKKISLYPGLTTVSFNEN